MSPTEFMGESLARDLLTGLEAEIRKLSRQNKSANKAILAHQNPDLNVRMVDVKASHELLGYIEMLGECANIEHIFFRAECLARYAIFGQRDEESRCELVRFYFDLFECRAVIEADRADRFDCSGVALETRLKGAVPGIEEMPELVAQREVTSAAIKTAPQPNGAFVSLDNESALEPLGIEFINGDNTDRASNAVEWNTVRNRTVLRAQLFVDFESKPPRLADIGQLHQIDNGITFAHCQ